MKIYLNDKDGKRKTVEATLIKENKKKTIVVKLSDGTIIIRNKTRDIPS